jgi:transmembrane sensor
MPLDTDETKLPTLKQQAIEWLILLRRHDLSEAETEAFANWLSEDVRHADAFAKAENTFNDMTLAALSPRVGAPVKQSTRKPESTSPVKTAKPQKANPAIFPRWLAVPLAVAASWLFAVALVLPKQSNLLDAYLSDYHTGTGEQQHIQLADGSQMLLNTNTAVSVDYRDELRYITLHHGQVQFTVAKDVQRPFEVKSGGLTTRALGTVFEVYRQESGAIDITVQEHTVSVRLPDDSHIRPVKVLEKHRLHYQGGKIAQPMPVNPEQAGAWRQRSLFINDRPLAELIDEIDRYRTGRVFLAGGGLKNHRVSGMFSLADPDAALAKVRKIMGLKETRLGPLWVVLHR